MHRTRRLGRLSASVVLAALIALAYSPASEWSHLAAHAGGHATLEHGHRHEHEEAHDHEHLHDWWDGSAHGDEEIGHNHVLLPNGDAAFVISPMFFAPPAGPPALFTPEARFVGAGAPDCRLSTAQGRVSQARSPPLAA